MQLMFGVQAKTLPLNPLLLLVFSLEAESLHCQQHLYKKKQITEASEQDRIPLDFGSFM